LASLLAFFLAAGFFFLGDVAAGLFLGAAFGAFVMFCVAGAFLSMSSPMLLVQNNICKYLYDFQMHCATYSDHLDLLP